MNAHRLSGCADNTACFPFAEKSADGKQRGASQLCQFQARKINVGMSVRLGPDLPGETYQEAAQAGRNFLGGDFAKTGVELVNLVLKTTRQVPPQHGKSVQGVLERAVLPD